MRVENTASQSPVRRGPLAVVQPLVHRQHELLEHAGLLLLVRSQGWPSLKINVTSSSIKSRKLIISIKQGRFDTEDVIRVRTGDHP